ncbi:MAG: Do family serine endopeptidase [Bacteroidia bacterium]|nr:Do family serine endopeptidase [Bacteroidia bacterium]
MKAKILLYLVAVALFTSVSTLAAYKWLGLDRSEVVFQEANNDPASSERLVKFAKGGDLTEKLDVPADFTEAAQKTTPTVVHIVSTQVANARSNREMQMPDMFRDFFGDDFFNMRPSPQGPQEAQASGSGVIISADGYIVTNNHVVADASKVEVILNNKQSYEAKVIGTDPSTDLAVIKIEAAGLPNVVLGNSDNVQVGQWVLAVGNPFNLESTVTAGIVSAKGRNLNILRDQSQAPIEAFIQTDAAVNPGNSGGALVNTSGELIGINTAIATPTGTYAGYSFAVPVNIVKKVMKDIIEYGTVQRAYLGINIRDLDGKYATEIGLKGISEGVRVEAVTPKSAAEEAGIKVGDVIVGIDERKINNTPQLLEEIAKRRPGNKVSVTVVRDGQRRSLEVFLKNKAGNEEITRLVNDPAHSVMQELGIELEELTREDLKELGLDHGLRVGRIYNGKIRNNTNMPEGFIITELGREPVKSGEEFIAKYQKIQGGVFISGINPKTNQEAYYAFPR